MIRIWQVQRSLILLGAFLLAPLSLAVGQTTISSGSDGAGDAPAMTQEDLDNLLAPIALYPDSLLSQIFMAATYPIEVVEAERWVRQNESLKGDALGKALEKEDWDPAVKSLVNFPQVLTMMSEQLDWMTKLGDAFLAQQQEVMNTVQRLRIKAQEQGNLESNEQQNVIVEAAPASSSSETTTIIRIEPAQPEVIYVPTYQPAVVYGSWWYPTPPAYYWRPPGYVASAAIGFGVGVACGAAWGYAWGGCNWRHGDIDIDVRRNSIYNNNINRSRYNNYGGAGNNWRHNPQHRRGADYRNRNTASQYGGRAAADAARSRDQFRGRAESGRQQINAGAADQFKGRDPARAQTRDARRPGGSGNRPNASGDRRPSRGQSAQQRPARPSSPQANRPQQRNPGANRPKQPSQSNRGGAFNGANNRGSNVKQQSNRGRSSRSGNASRGSRGGGSRSGGASRGGGGARRGGGGARGGGGRR